MNRAWTKSATRLRSPRSSQADTCATLVRGLWQRITLSTPPIRKPRSTTLATRAQAQMNIGAVCSVDMATGGAAKLVHRLQMVGAGQAGVTDHDLSVPVHIARLRGADFRHTLAPLVGG